MRMMSPGRRTISTASHRMKYGNSVLNNFTTKEAQSLQRLMTERYVLNAKKAALDLRQRSAPQVTEHTDDMERINLAIEDSTYEIQRIAREHTPALLELFKDPEVQRGMELLVPAEELAEDPTSARIWRTTVGSVGHRVASEGKFRYASHNSPDNKGNRSYTNKLESASVEDNMSYYELQALRHGRGRRGSTSISGSWKEVWGKSGAVLPCEAPQPIAWGRGYGGSSSASQYGGDGGSVMSSFRERSPSTSMAWRWDGGAGGGGAGGGEGGMGEAVEASSDVQALHPPTPTPPTAKEYADDALRLANAYIASVMSGKR